MAGGSGTRLWPLSRAGHPKQFLALNGEKTMLQQTAERLSDLHTSESITICNEEHRFLLAEQERDRRSRNNYFRAFGAHVATTIGLAASFEKDDDPLLLVLAADHVISNLTAFIEAVIKALFLAESGEYGRASSSG